MIAALRYEWRRITTIRSTFIMLACAIIASLLLGWLTVETMSMLSGAGSSSADAPAMPNLDLTQIIFTSTGGLITLIFFATIAAQAFGQEYRQGTIRLTLTAIPFRGRVFSAKLIIVLVVAFVGWVVATVLTYLLVSALVSGKNFAGSSTLEVTYLGRGALFVLGFCAIAFGVTVLTRILALGVIIPLMVWAVVESLLINLLGGTMAGPDGQVGSDGSTPLASESHHWVEYILPFHNGTNFVESSTTTIGGPSPAMSGLIYLAWIVVILGAAWLLFKKRDA